MRKLGKEQKHQRRNELAKGKWWPYEDGWNEQLWPKNSACAKREEHESELIDGEHQTEIQNAIDVLAGEDADRAGQNEKQ